MSDPEYPDEECVRVLRSTVALVLGARPSPQGLADNIVDALHTIAEAGARQEWSTVAANAGTIASLALVLQLDAMSRMPPKGPQH